MKRPSPALVVASIALFVALGGAGVAATLALAPVRSPQPLVLLPAHVSANGKVVGPRLTGSRSSAGVYTLTVRGDTFAPNATSRGVYTVNTSILSKGAAPGPATCAVASENLTSNGGAKAEVDCYTFNGAVGWQPTDAAFDLQIAGPSR